MLKGASLWHLTCFWNWFSGLGSPQGVDVAFWLSRGHPSPALQSSPTDHTLAPFSNQMTERKGSKRIISQNLLAHLLSSMLLTLEMYKMCKNILGLCDVCVHAPPPTHTCAVGTPCHEGRPSFWLLYLVRLVWACQPNWSQAKFHGRNLLVSGAGVQVCWHGDWSVGCQQRKHGF